jgi:transcriptional regulator with XRE-family HTH domain
MLTLKKAREAKGITLRHLEELTGIAHANLSKIESGKTDPRLSTLRTICNALGLTIEIK